MRTIFKSVLREQSVSADSIDIGTVGEPCEGQLPGKRYCFAYALGVGLADA